MTGESDPQNVGTPPETLIENERVELLQVHAMLKCLYEVLLYADDDDSVMHADVANVAARLIMECTNRLEVMKLRFQSEATDG